MTVLHLHIDTKYSNVHIISYLPESFFPFTHNILCDFPIRATSCISPVNVKADLTTNHWCHRLGSSQDTTWKHNLLASKCWSHHKSSTSIADRTISKQHRRMLAMFNMQQPRLILTHASLKCNQRRCMEKIVAS